jgi:hypothetical protein
VSLGRGLSVEPINAVKTDPVSQDLIAVSGRIRPRAKDAFIKAYPLRAGRRQNKPTFEIATVRGVVDRRLDYVVLPDSIE